MMSRFRIKLKLLRTFFRRLDMMNWHEIHESGRELYGQRLEEAEIYRMALDAARVEGRAPGLRARLGQLLIDLGHWMHGPTSEHTIQRDVEHTGAL
jgi:hypothetical protein